MRWKREVRDAAAGGRHQPYYHVLVDHRDRPFQSTYVAQENIVRPPLAASPSTPAEPTLSGQASEVTVLAWLNTWALAVTWLNAMKNAVCNKGKKCAYQDIIEQHIVAGCLCT